MTTIVGLALASAPVLGGKWHHLSYDLPFAVRPKVSVEDVSIIVMDQTSMYELRQAYNERWERTLHAGLLNYLHAVGAKLVVLDLTLDEATNDEADRALAEAIASHGKVILAGTPLEDIPKPPLGLFLTNSAGWGLAAVEHDRDLVPRIHYRGMEDCQSLAWAAASLADAPVTRGETEKDRLQARWKIERWLSYYGPPQTINHVPYAVATNRPPAYFSNRVVFVGSRNQAGAVAAKRDEFATPFILNEQYCSGVEVIATTYLNLVHGDWLIRMGRAQEAFIVLLAGILFGFGLRLMGPLSGAGLALIGAAAIAVIACWVVWTQRIWFSWAVVSGAQIPCAYLCALIAQARRVQSAPAAAPPHQDPIEVKPVVIPHHTMLRKIGAGGYGEVWLVRNVLDLYCAAKVVSRAHFKSDESYEREFRGLQSYMPISDSHPGLLQINFVGRVDPEGYFFYLMEPADDQRHGTEIDPERYAPRTLGSDLVSRGGRIPVLECVSSMIWLTEGLEHLHKHERIHRDIKPTNIVFVRGKPKFADIGLVTALGGTTMVGTEGYMPPEGPNSIAADIYAFGKVVYQACVGLPADHFPEGLGNSDRPSLRDLSEVLFKACALNPHQRFPSAAALRTALVSVRDRLAAERDEDTPTQRL